MDKNLVITDESQVSEHKARMRFGRDLELDDVRSVLSTKQGRRFLTRLLTKCNVHRSVWSNSAAIHRDAGIQEVGHFILGEIVAADKEMASQLLVEAYESAEPKNKNQKESK